MSAFKTIKGMLLGAILAGGAFMYIAVDKRKKKKVFRCAKKTVRAVESAVHDAVDFDT